MKKHLLSRLAVACKWSIALGFIVNAGMSHAAVYPQCPPEAAKYLADGTTVNPNYNSNIVCKHVAAGDGFMYYSETDTSSPTGLRRGFMFGFSDMTTVPNDQVMNQGYLNAKWPAPPMEFKEGNEVYWSLTNTGMAMRPDLFDPHSIHFHGFPQASSFFDGVPDGSMTINMGSTMTYYYKIQKPGTYMYHCHVESTEHMQMGMLGTLNVKPLQDGTAKTVTRADGSQVTYTKFVYNDGDGSTGYDVDFSLQLGSFDAAFHDKHEAVQPLPFSSLRTTHPFINGRGYPDTASLADMPTPVLDDGPLAESSQKTSSLVSATKGQKILLRLTNLNVIDYFTVTALGLQMKVVGAGANQAKGRDANGVSGKDWSYDTNSVTLGGGEGVDVIIDTKDVATGTYFLYTTNLNFLSNGDEDRGGLMTHVVIN
jgi:FtsP/CotA-like multicopper oxidase with cupredoxin domain